MFGKHKLKNLAKYWDSLLLVETQVKVSELQKNTDGVDERILVDSTFLELHPYVTIKITKRGPGGCEEGGGSRSMKE